MEKIKCMYKKVFRFFDRVEDRVRGTLSKHPIVYAICAGVAVVLFWRGVWHTGDILEAKGGFLGFIFSGPISILLALGLLLITGVFVSAFVGDMLVLSGLKKEKKLVDKTEDEIQKEAHDIQDIEQVIDDLYEEIDEMGDQQKQLEQKIDTQNKLLEELNSKLKD
jgi:hypothetical protein